MQQQPEPIVLEIAHPVADPSELLCDEVLGLSWSVGDAGHVVVEDLGFPSGDGLGQPGELGNVGLGSVLVEGDQLPSGGMQILGCVHLTEELLAEDAGPTLAVGIADIERTKQLVPLAIRQALPAPGHQSSGFEQWILLAAPVAQALLLDPAADVIDHRVAQLHAVKTVHRDCGVRQVGEDPIEVAPVGIDGHRLDGLSPGWCALSEPVAHVVGVAASDDVEEPPADHVDETGDVEGVMLTVGTEHLVLVDAEGIDVVEPGWVVHQGLAVAADAVHRAFPADPELAGYLSHRGAVLADLPADLGGCPSGQRILDQIALLGERLGGTVRVPTDPLSLPPHQAHRSATGGKVTYLGDRAPVANRSDTATPTSHHVGRGLDGDEQLAGVPWV